METHMKKILDKSRADQIGQLHKSLDRVTLKKMKYVFFLRLHMGSISYGDTLCQFLYFYSDANTPRKQLECFGS